MPLEGFRRLVLRSAATAVGSSTVCRQVDAFGEILVQACPASEMNPGGDRQTVPLNTYRHRTCAASLPIPGRVRLGPEIWQPWHNANGTN
jgi:hypothetical protein